jgi:hypothetical protein
MVARASECIFLHWLPRLCPARQMNQSATELSHRQWCACLYRYLLGTGPRPSVPCILCTVTVTSLFKRPSQVPVQQILQSLTLLQIPATGQPSHLLLCAPCSACYVKHCSAPAVALKLSSEPTELNPGPLYDTITSTHCHFGLDLQNRSSKMQPFTQISRTPTKPCEQNHYLIVANCAATRQRQARVTTELHDLRPAVVLQLPACFLQRPG